MRGYRGTFIAVFSERGPELIFNTTTLSPHQVLTLGLQGLMLPQHGEQGAMYGPLPTYHPDVLGFVVTWRTSVTHSPDLRFLLHGRPVNAWILMAKPLARRACQYRDELQEELRLMLPQLSLEAANGLREENLAELERRIRQILTHLPTS